MDPIIKKLDYYTELTLVNHWKQSVNKTILNSFNNSSEDDDWVFVQPTNITEPNCGQVVNK